MLALSSGKQDESRYKNIGCAARFSNQIQAFDVQEIEQLISDRNACRKRGEYSKAQQLSLALCTRLRNMRFNRMTVYRANKED